MYGAVGDASVEGIGWSMGLVILTIALVTFVLVDLVKVFTITFWNKKYEKTLIQKNQTRAQRFQQDHNQSLEWER